MKDKQITAQEAAALVKDGMTVMVGGFLSVGTPEIIMDALVESGVKDLTIICNDGGVTTENKETGELTHTGVAKLIHNHQVKKLIATHIGLNKEVAAQMNAGELEVELVHQGSMAEKVRAGGAGLGGVLTPTGLGTDVAEGKEVINIQGKDYLLELPLHADVALIRGSVVDTYGNTIYAGTTKNFNTVMATAADTVIVAAEKIVSTSELSPDHIMTPFIFVDYIVGGEK